MTTLPRTWTFAILLLPPILLGGPTRDAAEPSAAERFATVPPAPAALADPADTLYQDAREALSRGDYTRAARLFQRIVAEDPRSEYAPDALYWRAFALYRAGGAANLRAALASLEEQARRWPNAATRGDADALRVRLNGALARRGDPASAEAVVAIAGGDDCPEEDDDIRLAALNALMDMDSEKAVPILERVLGRRDACSVKLRKHAVFIVADSDSPRALRILLDVARSDPDREVRAQAVQWLGEVESEESIDALIDILENSDDHELRDKALFALSEHHSPRVAPTLRRFALDEGQPAEIREKAIFWLSEVESEETVPFLMDLYRTLDDPDLRERVLFSIAETEDPRAVTWLLGIARDESQSEELRGKALFWAAETEMADEALLELWDDVESAEIKRHLLHAYSEIDSPRTIEKLFEIARDERDPELRKAALLWIGESDDPRAAEFLERIVSE